MRGADILVRSLINAGVDRIFSLSGNQIMPVFDACFGAGLEIIHTRHEAAAVYMAEAYAQLTGQVGVALVTAGSGAANALGGLFAANESETPLLLLTGDSPLAQDGLGAFQEMDQVPMTAPITRLSLRTRHASELGQDVVRALRAARSDRAGPVHLALPFDVVEDEVSGSLLPTAGAFDREPMHPDYKDISALLDALSEVVRPVIICGPPLNATRFGRLAALANALDAPVIPMESPRGLKDPSLGDIREILHKADLIVNLGKRVDFTLPAGEIAPSASEARWINVQPSARERDRARQNLGGRLWHSISANPHDTAERLIQLGPATVNRSCWRKEVHLLTSSRCFHRTPPEGTGAKITSEELCAAVQRQINRADQAVLVCDGGEFGQWAQACCTAPSRIINGLSGAIGGGLCYGIAARVARPGATVFSLMGDGTVGFHFAEFETAARLELPFVAVIGNDMRWNAEHQIQLRNYGSDRLFGCQLSEARYDLAAAALGGHGEFVTDGGELDSALDRAVSSKRPACVNVIIEGQPAP